jgi:hypothetical protein
MSNEINNFISELKKTRDYSSFGPKGNEGKTNKKVEKVASVEHTLTIHSDNNQQAVQQVQEGSSIISIIIKEDSNQSQVHLVGLNESSIKPDAVDEAIEPINLERVAFVQPDKSKPIKVQKEKMPQSLDVLNREGCVYEPIKMSSAFIDYVSEANANDSFKFSRKKRNDLDDNTYEILMQLKHYGQIKSVSTLINVILSDFIKNNKEALQTLFAASSKRIHF